MTQIPVVYKPTNFSPSSFERFVVWIDADRYEEVEKKGYIHANLFLMKCEAEIVSIRRKIQKQITTKRIDNIDEV